MKRIALILALLCATSAHAQQQVQPVNGVLTLNLAPSVNSFKVIIGQTITSVVFQNQSPGGTATVIFTENATGGFSVTFGGNITNACTVTTTANASTICTFTYDASSNTWIGGGSGGGSSSVGFSGNIINASAATYALPLTTTIHDGTLNATTTVTCNGCFTSTAVDGGKQIFSIGAAGGGGLILNTTIASVTNTNTAIATAAATGSCSGNCWITFGNIADTALTAIHTDAKTMCAAKGDAVVLLPSSDILVTIGNMNDQPTACTAGGGNARYGITYTGVDPSATRFILHPTLFAYNGPGCTTFTNTSPLGATNICFFAQVRSWRNLSFWGVNNAGSGTGQANVSLMGTGGSGLNYSVDHVKCMYVNVGVGFYFGASDNIVNSIESDGCGSAAGVEWAGNGSITDGFMGDGGLRALRVSGNLAATGVRFGNLGVQTGPLIDVAGTLSCFHCLAPSGGDTAANTQLFNNAGTLNLFGGTFDIHNNASNVRALNLQAGSNTHLCGTTFNATQAGGVFINAGSGANIFDDCPNTISFSTFLTGGPINWFGSASAVGTAPATGNFALTNATFTSTAGADQKHFTLTITASAAAAVTVAYTFPKAFLVAPGSCHAQQTGGTNPILTWSTSVAPTTTTVTFLSTAAAVNTDTIILAVDCQ